MPGRIAAIVWHVVSRMLITWSLALGLLAGLNWMVGQVVASSWTQGFLVGVAAVVLGDVALVIETRWIHGPPRKQGARPS